MADGATPLKVLSIVGAGRSGTTVLASILNEFDGFASAGELRWLWERGVVNPRPCACGNVPTRCPVWSSVLQEALLTADPGCQRTRAEDIVAAQADLARRRNLLRTLRNVNATSAEPRALATLLEPTGRALAAFAAATGARVVVDTSKRPLDAAVLAAIENVDLYFLHVVRDPRAVVHSWRRAKSFSVDGETRTIGTRGLPSTARRWMANGLSTEILRRRVPAHRWLHMRYEDFAQDPRAAVDDILSMLHESGQTPFHDADTVLLHENHIVAGNPSRFTTGLVTITADEEWRTRMSRRDQLLTELMTLPLLLRYGYPVTVRRHAPSVP